jgi:hypothetical protein
MIVTVPALSVCAEYDRQVGALTPAASSGPSRHDWYDVPSLCCDPRVKVQDARHATAAHVCAGPVLEKGRLTKGD